MKKKLEGGEVDSEKMFLVRFVKNMRNKKN